MPLTVSTCPACARDLGHADGCTKAHLDLPDRVYTRARVGRLDADGRRCAGCQAVVGRFHHLGCPVEDCPRCGHQLRHCGCAPTVT